MAIHQNNERQSLWLKNTKEGGAKATILEMVGRIEQIKQLKKGLYLLHNLMHKDVDEAFKEVEEAIQTLKGTLKEYN